MLHMAKPCSLLGGSGTCPPKNIFKMVQFGMYFDPILSYCLIDEDLTGLFSAPKCF